MKWNTDRNASWVMFANELGNFPERLLLLSLLKEPKSVDTDIRGRGYYYSMNFLYVHYMYCRLVRWPREAGIMLEKELSDKSRVRSFESRPSSAGREPLMLLFCSSLQSMIIFINASEFRILWLRQARLNWLTYRIWRFDKLPMLGESVPDRPWLGMPLRPPTQKSNHMSANNKCYTVVTSKLHLQSNHEAVWGTSDHRPAARIDSILVPVVENVIWVL